jgi:hypothetical protein
MTRKDYIKIAEAISECVESIGAENVYKVGAEFSKLLGRDNPRFDSGRFDEYLRKCVGARYA